MIKTTLLTLFITALTLQANQSLIGYFPNWAMYSPKAGIAKNFTVKDIDFSKWTRIHYAFYWVTEQGEVIGTDAWADEIQLFGRENAAGTQVALRRSLSPWNSNSMPAKTTKFDIENGLIEKAHQAGVELLISFGGWTGSAPFIAMSANPTARTRFVKDCMSLMRPYDQGGYNIDGIDLDWEYPGDVHAFYTQAGQQQHNGTAADKDNFMLLLKEMRDSIDTYMPGKLLTAALSCNEAKIAKGYDVPGLDTLLDEANLMTYDFWGSFANPLVNDHHTGLYSSGISGLDPNWNVAGAVSVYKNLGLSPEKMNIGLAFYGRSVQGGEKPGDTFTGAYAWPGSGVQDASSPNYFQIVNEIKNGSITESWDATAMAPYASGNGVYVSYDNPRSIGLKCMFILEQGLKGAIVWDIWGDWMADGSTPLIDTAASLLLGDTPSNPVSIDRKAPFLEVESLNLPEYNLLGQRVPNYGRRFWKQEIIHPKSP